ncbi:MAG TPA: GntR family transcriptional regulator [Gryllotalpicola sp.]
MAGTKGEFLRQELHQLVEAMSPGEQIAPERELMVRYDVARETLRRALDELAAEGVIERRAGVGTFVSRPKLTQAVRVRSFTQDMAERHMSSASRIIRHSVAVAGAVLGQALRISPGDRVLSIERLRLADGEPMALESLSIPAALVPDLDIVSLRSRSLYETLASDYGISIEGGTQTIEATVADEEESRLLRVPLLSPALLIERVTWDQNERRIEFVRSRYRGDRYKFQVDLAGAPAAHS